MIPWQRAFKHHGLGTLMFPSRSEECTSPQAHPMLASPQVLECRLSAFLKVISACGWPLSGCQEPGTTSVACPNRAQESHILWPRKRKLGEGREKQLLVPEGPLVSDETPPEALLQPVHGIHTMREGRTCLGLSGLLML